MPFPNKDTQFKPHNNANPKGYPKGVPNTKTRLKRLLEITQQKENPYTKELEGFSVIEQVDIALIQKSLAGDMTAIRELYNRLEGLPIQATDDPPPPNPVQIIDETEKL